MDVVPNQYPVSKCLHKNRHSQRPIRTNGAVLYILKENVMTKKVIIGYRTALGEYLDQLSIRWGRYSDDSIFIWIVDEQQLFDLASGYTAWYIGSRL